MGELWTLLLAVAGWALFLATVVLLVVEMRSASAWKRRANEASALCDTALDLLDKRREQCSQLLDIAARALNLLRGSKAL